jgi:malate dehydrogenase (oxaloacetate-decarboxylating)(NADP+)
MQNKPSKFVDGAIFAGPTDRPIVGVLEASDEASDKKTYDLAIRQKSLPKSVARAGGALAWNQKPELVPLVKMLDGMVNPQSADDALAEVKSMIQLDNYLWAHMWMKMLQAKNINAYYELMIKNPSLMLPVMYTPTVGEVCQKYGKLPFNKRGCYLSITDRGRFKKVLDEYAQAELEKDADGKPICDCIVFSDGGRILGLGDLGAWGMGIPVGKLDLYTVCGGVNPHRVIPLIIDAGCGDSSKNTDKLEIRDHPLYTGLKQDRVMIPSDAGTMVNSCYYGPDNVIDEFFQAATELFSDTCLLQFEDFNSNDAFPLLARYRHQYLTYNDDIQGTAAVAVAGIMGAIKLKSPNTSDLIAAIKEETFVFFGAGSANIGAASLLIDEANVDASRVIICGSRGLIWKSEDGSEGTFKNNEQKWLAYKGKPSFPCEKLVDIIKHVKPTVLVGAVGVSPNCFTKEVVDLMVDISSETGTRPIIFALSNPKSQAEITAQNCYTWSNGAAIFGSGTHFDPVEVSGKKHSPGQVNNVYIFPGMSFGSICCRAKKIPERFFLVAAQAVANSLSQQDLEEDRVIPHRDMVQKVNLNVAAAVVVEAQRLDLAGRRLGADFRTVRAALEEMMWKPGR